MVADPFVDTNILIYTLSRDDRRAGLAQRVLREGGVVSVQVLNEFVAVLRGRYGLAWTDIQTPLDLIHSNFTVTPVTLQTHRLGVRVAEQYGFRIYDSLLLAAAMEAGCSLFLSENLQHGQVIDDVLTILNPFQ
jgi:predicted nucleic acid-binding protein